MRPSKIHITGNAGSGKTTLALALGDLLGLPVYHLDTVVWQPGWRKTPADQRRDLERSLIGGAAWIIEGVSEQVRQAADLVIFLDQPRHRCLFRAFKRNLPYMFRSRPELPTDCPEALIAPRLFRIVIAFPGRVRPALLAEAGASCRYRVIRTSEQLRRLMGDLAAMGGPK